MHVPQLWLGVPDGAMELLTVAGIILGTMAGSASVVPPEEQNMLLPVFD